MNRLITNGLLGLIAASLPLFAQFLSTSYGTKSTLGFDILLYQPFSFAYILLIFVVFNLSNLYLPWAIKKESKVRSMSEALLWTCGWFISTFLLLSQLHFILSGQ